MSTQKMTPNTSVPIVTTVPKATPAQVLEILQGLAKFYLTPKTRHPLISFPSLGRLTGFNWIDLQDQILQNQSFHVLSGTLPGHRIAHIVMVKSVTCRAYVNSPHEHPDVVEYFGKDFMLVASKGIVL
jgi:hypothetical protein